MFTLEKTLLSYLVLLICVSSTYTQSLSHTSKLSEEVNARIYHASHFPASAYQIFHKANSIDHARDLHLIEGSQLLGINKQALIRLNNSNEDLIQVELPYQNGKILLSLFPFNPFSDQLSIKSSQGIIDLNESIRFYRGIVEGDDQSVVALSIYQDEIMGIISSRKLGNMVLARHTFYPDIHVLYQENQLNAPVPFSCEALVVPGYNPTFPSERSTARSSSDACVNIFLEASYSIYQNFDNDLDQVINFITGLFNQVSTIYANEGIHLVLSDLYIWTENDPYDHETTSSALESFMNAPLKGNGHLRHLLDMVDNNNGGRAYVDVLCEKVMNVGYSNIVPYYFGTPTYSWSVNVIAHELGHGLGSFHTQDCIWGPENCMAIDGCAAPNPEIGCGSCSEAPVPDKGTIMSYCHVKTGIDFTLGFGKEPGDLIRNRIAEANCLSPCGSEPSGVCQLSIEDVEVKPATCNAPNGSIVIDVSGASGTETYDIGDGPQANNQFDGLPSGEYQIIVRDGISCERTVSATVEMTSNAPVLELIVSNASCMGKDGTLLIIPSGGSGPYQYEFDGRLTTDSFITRIEPGEYEVNLVDSEGCIATQKFSIYEESAPAIETVIKSTQCGLNNGQVNLVALGGTAPFHFDLSSKDFDTTVYTSSAAVFENLASGIYQITVRDSHDCRDSIDIRVDHSEAISVELMGKAASCEQANGSVEIMASGGRAPYRYFLTDKEQLGPTLTQLSTGIYTIGVIDADQCGVESTITVPYDSTFVAPQLPPVLDLCEGDTIYIDAGLPNLARASCNYNNVEIGDFNKTLAISQPGDYRMIATYSDQCRLSSDMHVIGRNLPQLKLPSRDTICAGQYWELPDPDSSFTYRWSNEIAGTKANFKESGNYGLQVTDVFGCAQSTSLDIHVVQPVELTADQENIVICPGEEVQLSVFGADTYSWVTDDPSILDRAIPDPIVAPYQPQRYKVIGLNSCFQDTMELSVAFFPEQVVLPQDTTVLVGFPFTISLPQAVDVKWRSELKLDCEACNKTIVTTRSKGDLFVSYTDQYGCFRQDSVHLSVRNLDEILPRLVNVITPNGDQQNDYLSFGRGDSIQKMQLQVFGQDGSTLFESKDYKNDWSGTIEGSPLPEGVYFYVLTLQLYGQVIQVDSDLTIIRD